MTFPVIVQPVNGQFAASLVGAPDVRVTASTRDQAIAALETVIQRRVQQGELISLEIGRRGVSDLAGQFRDDPTLREICEEAYRQRDAEPLE